MKEKEIQTYEELIHYIIKKTFFIFYKGITLQKYQHSYLKIKRKSFGTIQKVIVYIIRIIR